MNKKFELLFDNNEFLKSRSNDCDCNTCDSGDCCDYVADCNFSFPQLNFPINSNDCDCNSCDSGDCCDYSGLSSMSFQNQILTDLPKEIINKEQFVIEPSTISVDLSDGYFAFTNSRKPGVVVLNSIAKQLLENFRKPEVINVHQKDEFNNLLKLISTGLLIPNSEVFHSISKMLPKQALSVWLHMTNDCTLQCKYCYVKKGKDNMSPEIGKKAIDMIFNEANRTGFSKVILRYAGGEPSLNLDVVEEIHNYAINKANETNIVLDELIMTNGFINKITRKRIIDLGIKVMVSVDDFEDFQDYQRPSIEKKQTSIQILNTVNDLIASGVDLRVSITLCHQEPDNLIKLSDFLLKNNVSFRMSFPRDNTYFNERDKFIPDNDRLIDVVEKILSHYCQNPPKQTLINCFTDRAYLSNPHSFTCPVGKSYFVIDQLGNISKCQQEIEHPITTIFEEKPIDKILDNKSVFQNVSVDEKGKCSDCKWKYWCSGGCSALTTKTYGSSNNPSPFCSVYQAILPNTLRLEGFRILKYFKTSIN